MSKKGEKGVCMLRGLVCAVRFVRREFEFSRTFSPHYPRKSPCLREVSNLIRNQRKAMEGSFEVGSSRQNSQEDEHEQRLLIGNATMEFLSHGHSISSMVLDPDL